MLRTFKKYTTIYFLLFGLFIFAQKTDDIVKESTCYFSLDSVGGFDNECAEFLKKRIAESQFFLVGEQHNIHLIETFVSSLIPFLKENGYNDYLTEIGPMAAIKLTNLTKRSTALKDYYSKYLAQTHLPPFGFFSTKEEEKTLQQLKHYSMQLHGIDFENYGSYLAYIDDLYTNTDKDNISEALYTQVYAFIKSEYRKGKNNFNPDLMNKLLHSNDLKNFLSLSSNEINNPLIREFELSLQINHQLTLGFWQRRVDNMKRNFAKYYHLKNTTEKLPKLFIKLGAIHTARGISFSGNLEVGNMIYELANINQTKSFSVITFPRYILNEQTGIAEDTIEEDDKEILKFTLPNLWTVIDLHKLNELSTLNNIRLGKNFIRYIEKYDALIIPPATPYSKKLP